VADNANNGALARFVHETLSDVAYCLCTATVCVRGRGMG